MEPYRVKLQAEHERLMKEIEELSKTRDFGSDVDSGDEEASEGEDTANRLAMIEDIKGRVNEIEDALHLIAAGTYGTCTRCGEPISKETLDLVPESALCAACKKAS